MRSTVSDCVAKVLSNACKLYLTKNVLNVSISVHKKQMVKLLSMTEINISVIFWSTYLWHLLQIEQRVHDFIYRNICVLLTLLFSQSNNFICPFPSPVGSWNHPPLSQDPVPVGRHSDWPPWWPLHSGEVGQEQTEANHPWDSRKAGSRP